MKNKSDHIHCDEQGNQDRELHPDIPFEIIGNVFQNPELLEKSK